MGSPARGHQFEYRAAHRERGRAGPAARLRGQSVLPRGYARPRTRPWSRRIPSRQSYNAGLQLTSWAVTGDWEVPLGRFFELRGEVYRGSGLGSLGSGAYKDALYGTDPVTGTAKTVGLNAAGGWSELKLRLNRTGEANADFGLDNAFASDFRRVALDPYANPVQYYARNSTVVGNMIYRPRAYLIFSPEYRRIASWRITGPHNTANLFTMSFGYRF